MSPGEFEELVAWIEARWQTRAYSRWEALVEEFLQVPVEAARAAITEHWNAGNQHPLVPSQLRKKALRLAFDRGMMDPQSSHCDTRGFHGVFAVTTLDSYFGQIPTSDGLKTLPVGFREGTCVECGHVVVAEETKILTAGEKAEKGTQEVDVI